MLEVLAHTEHIYVFLRVRVFDGRQRKTVNGLLQINHSRSKVVLVIRMNGLSPSHPAHTSGKSESSHSFLRGSLRIPNPRSPILFLDF